MPFDRNKIVADVVEALEEIDRLNKIIESKDRTIQTMQATNESLGFSIEAIHAKMEAHYRKEPHTTL